jgi:ureidoacrylate peracid hydrolase
MNRRAFANAIGIGTLGAATVDLDRSAAQGRSAERPPPATPARPVRLNASPSPITIDAAKTAVVVVDMQNDFGSEGGMFHRAGIDISMIRAAVAPTKRVLGAARSARIPVVYLKMAFRPDMSDAGAIDSPNRARHDLLGAGTTIHAPNGKESRVLIRDTWNTDIVDALAPEVGDVVLYKHRFSGFFQTDLDATLKRMGATYLVVVGCTTSICVESTIRDGMFRDYSCVLLKDCTGEPIGQGLSRSNHEASLLSIQTLLGWVADSDAFVASLRAADAHRSAPV